MISATDAMGQTAAALVIPAIICAIIGFYLRDIKQKLWGLLIAFAIAFAVTAFALWIASIWAQVS